VITAPIGDGQTSGLSARSCAQPCVHRRAAFGAAAGHGHLRPRSCRAVVAGHKTKTPSDVNAGTLGW